MAFCKSVDGGSSRHFSLHYIYSSVDPPKKNPFHIVSLREPATETSQAPLFNVHDHRTRTSPPYFFRRPTRRTSRPHPPQTAPSSTAPYHPRRTLKPYTHPPLFRSRFSCGGIHPTGAALPTPSSTAPDLARQLPRSLHLNLFTDAAMHESTNHIAKHTHLFYCAFLLLPASSCLILGEPVYVHNSP